MNLPAPLSRVATLAAAAGLAAILSGCIKPADQKAPANNPAPKAEPFAAAPAAPTQPPSIAGIPAASIAAAERAKAKVEIASTATTDNGAHYRQAQSLYAEKKYREALAALDQIQAELMTAPQHKAVSALRAPLEAALVR